MQSRTPGLNMNINFLIALLLFVVHTSVFSQSTGGMPPVRINPKSIEKSNEIIKPIPFNSSTLINEGWQFFIGKNGFVDEKKAYDYTLAAIYSIDESAADKKSLSIAKNNLLVIYSCSLNKSVRNILKADQYPQDFEDSNSIDNLIWAIFLQRKNIPNYKINETYRIIRENFPNHRVNKYLEQLNGNPPSSIEAAYKFLRGQIDNGDAEASMRYGYAFECAFDSTNIDEAIKWYEKAKEIYLNDESNVRRFNSINDRIKRLQLIKDGKFNNL